MKKSITEYEMTKRTSQFDCVFQTDSLCELWDGEDGDGYWERWGYSNQRWYLIDFNDSVEEDEDWEQYQEEADEAEFKAQETRGQHPLRRVEQRAGKLLDYWKWEVYAPAEYLPYTQVLVPARMWRAYIQRQ